MKVVEENKTVFDLLEQQYNIKIVTVKLECPICGHSWGIRLSDFDKHIYISDKKFTCSNCNK